MNSQANEASLIEVIAEASLRQTPVSAVDAAAQARGAGVQNGRALARLLIAHLQAGEAADSIGACVRAIESRSDLAVFCFELINHAPVTERTLMVLAKVLAIATPGHPLAALAASDYLRVAPAYDAVRVGATLQVAAPRDAGFPASFAGLLISTEKPLADYSAVGTVARDGDRVTLALDPQSPLLADGFNIAPPCILVMGSPSPPAPLWSRAIAKARRGWLRLTKA